MNQIYLNKLDLENTNNKCKEEKINLIQNQLELNNIINEKPKEEEQLLINNKNQLALDIKEKKENQLFKKIEPKMICCFQRRTKYPSDLGSLSGFFLTVFYFNFFSILITICLSQTKTAYTISDTLNNIYNILIVILWIIFAITIIFLIDVFSTDPGIQRGSPISKEKYIDSKIKKIVGGKKYFLKYCDTCHLIRDIRTFHCKICGICVEKHDHHCFRVSNCIGVYNYKKFYIFINSSLIYLLYVFGICLHYLNYYNGKKTSKVWIFLLMTFVTIFDLIFILIVFTLDMQHIDVITSNITTRESIKKKRYKVYDRGLKENCYEAMCRDYIKEM